MYDKMSDQFQQSFKPLNDLVAVNAKAVERLVQQQSALFTTTLSDSVSYSQNLWAQKDAATVMEQQKDFAEKLQEKLTDAAKDAYAVIADTQEKAGEIFKGAFAQAQETASAATATATKAVKAAK